LYLLNLTFQDNSKYLGVAIINDLDWGLHINSITTKANKTLGFLHRNMKNCTRKVKNLTYISLKSILKTAAQDCDITSLGLEMMEEKIDVALDCNAETKKVTIEDLESQRESARRLSAFAEQDLVLITLLQKPIKH
jgi:hypothetical protein